MIINTPSLNALRTQFESRFRSVYNETETWYANLATEVPVSTGTATYGWMANAIALREWVGPRIAIAMAEHEYVLGNRDYEATFEVPRKQILDDNLGIYDAAIVPQFAAATAKHPDSELVRLVFAANPDGFDGEAFWSTAHPTYADGGGTYSNDFDLELTETDLEASAIAVQTVRTAMRTIVGENGLILQTDPRLLVVPPELEYVASKLARSEKLPASGGAAGAGTTGVDNVLRGVIDYLVIPELSAISASDWYLFDVSKPLKALLWQVRSRPVLRAFEDPTDFNVFKNNVFTWGIDGDDGGPYRANAGVTLPFLSARSGPT